MAKVKKKALCYVCLSTMRPHQVVYLGRDKDTGKKVLRHEGCYPGSYNWLNSEAGVNSKNYELFKEKTSTKLTVEKVAKLIPSIENNDEGQQLIHKFNTSSDPKERKKLRRKLRKMNIYISNLKKPSSTKKLSNQSEDDNPFISERKMVNFKKKPRRKSK